MSKELHERLSRYGKKSYHIVRSKPERAVSDVMKFLCKMKMVPQLIIFDFPGHALTSAMMDLSITMDFISPIEADPQSLASSFAYVKTIRDLGGGFEGSRIQDFFLLWNKINRTTSTTVIDLFSQNAEGDCRFSIPVSTTPSDSAGNWHKGVSKVYSAAPTCPLHRLSALRLEWMSG